MKIESLDIDQSPQMPQGLVSCIMIFFNTEKFIEEAIQSVFAQTYDHWELLLVDDGSSDFSTKIALRYAENYPNQVRYLEHPGHQNRGMSATRNLGIRHARGEYIAFLDADDVWLPQKLERQLALLKHYPEAAMVCGPSLLWYSWAHPSTGQSKTQLDPVFKEPQLDWIHPIFKQETNSNQLYYPPQLLKLFLQSKARTPGTCSILMRQTALQTTGGFEESFRGMYEDRVFFSKVYFKVPVLVTNECWDHYRRHPDSVCAVTQKELSLWKPEAGYLAFLTWMADYLTQENNQDVQIWWHLQSRLWICKIPILFILDSLIAQLRVRLRLRSRLKKIRNFTWFLPSKIVES